MMQNLPMRSPYPPDPGESWAGSSHGRRLTALEREEVTRLLPDLFGRHFLQIGGWGGEGDWLARSEMLHRAVLAIGGSGHAEARVDAARLPLPDRSVDAILLPHTLEFAASPHNLLREVSRVLSDRGRLLVLGFNPWSALGWRRRLGMAPRALPREAHMVSPGRVSDWLSLLDFQIDAARRYGVGFPWLAPRADGEPFSPASLLQGFSEGWLLSARKRVAPLNLITRTQRAQVRPLIVQAPATRREEAAESPQ